MTLICAVILTIAAVSMTPSSEQWEQNAMDRFDYNRHDLIYVGAKLPD